MWPGTAATAPLLSLVPWKARFVARYTAAEVHDRERHRQWPGISISCSCSHLGVAEVADLDQRPRAAVQQRVLQLDVAVHHALRDTGKTCDT